MSPLYIDLAMETGFNFLSLEQLYSIKNYSVPYVDPLWIIRVVALENI